MTGRFGTGTRLERLNFAQWQGINTWVSAPYYANGTLEWHTGVGKTHACHKAYTRFRQKFPADVPENNIIVVVPTIKLKEDWEKPGGHIQKWNLQNIQVFVINTYITQVHRCRLLIIDEIHRVLGEDAESFNKTIDITNTQFRLGLSATLTFEEKEMLIRKAMPVCHTITEDEARAEGFTSDYIEYNLAVPFNHVEKAHYEQYSRQHDSNQRFFVLDRGFDFQLAMSCTKNMDACRRVATYRGWTPDMGDKHEDSPVNIKKYANMWNQGMTKRKNILYNCLGKVDATQELIERFAHATIMTFSQTADMADAITARLPDISRSYHTKVKGETRAVGGKSGRVSADNVKKETLLFFAKRKIRVLNAVKALDEGYDLPMINMSIITSGSSKARQQKQRKGRTTRFDENDVGKKAIIVNLYVPNTQDEKWLKERQGDNAKVYWVSSIDDIGYEEPIEGADFDIAASGNYHY